MKKTFFTAISILAITTSVFADEKKTKNTDVIKEDIVAPLHCRTVSATDTEGNVIASASCCRNMSKTATTADYVAANVELDDCASKKLDRTLEATD